MVRSTRTYVELPVPREVWELIWSKLNDSGYDHAIDNDEGVIDMHGLALVVGKGEQLQEVTDVKKENDTLRKLLANSDAKCPYCGLAKEDMNRCSHGFPGCARADDMMLGGDDAETGMRP